MPKSNTRKLNDTQLVIPSSASQREDGLAVLPEGMRAASIKAAVIRLTKLGFLKQVRVKRALLPVCIASETVYASNRAAKMTSTAPIVAVAIRRARSFRSPRSTPRRSRKIAPRNEPIMPVSA